MDTKQLNEQLYAKRALVGTKAHCICEDCVFYEEQIMKNDALVHFLHRKGLDPRKAGASITWLISFKYMQIKKKRLRSATRK